jgi:hypothetical protein
MALETEPLSTAKQVAAEQEEGLVPISPSGAELHPSRRLALWLRDLLGRSAAMFAPIVIIQSQERVKTLKGELEAFKILMTVAERTGRVGRLPGRMITYYYSPQVKAIVSLREETSSGAEGAMTTSALVDFKVNQWMS